MNSSATSHFWDQTERRNLNSNRRREKNRRTLRERRCDTRESKTHKRTLRGWIRSFTRMRLGVDRRKTIDQRAGIDRRDSTPRSMLTKDELADLLK